MSVEDKYGFDKYSKLLFYFYVQKKSYNEFYSTI